jgi:uncharacterized membrane protein
VQPQEHRRTRLTARLILWIQSTSCGVSPTWTYFATALLVPVLLASASLLVAAAALLRTISSRRDTN